MYTTCPTQPILLDLITLLLFGEEYKLYIHTHTHTHKHTCMHAYIHMCKHTHTCMFVCKWGGRLTNSCTANISWSFVHPHSLNLLAALYLPWSTASYIAGSHSFLLSFPMLADTVRSPRWCTRNTGSLLRGINLLMEALCWRVSLCSLWLLPLSVLPIDPRSRSSWF
jgi:hypothetical protein